MAKITKRIVDGLSPRADGKDLFVWDEGDGALKGFGVRVKPSGIGSYIIQYRNPEGRTRRHVLGRVGVLAPEQARSIAVTKLADVAQGGDPSAQRTRLRKALRVSDLCDQYLSEANQHVKASTLYVDKSRIEAHVKPLLGNRAVSGLTRADLQQFQLDIANGKTTRREIIDGRLRIVSGGKAVAARTLGMMHTILEFALVNGTISNNPAAGIKKFQDKKNDRYLSPEELIRFGKALQKAEAINSTAVSAIRMLLLTGCRRNEVLKLPHACVDLRAKCIRLADTKSGAQLRPLGQAAVRLLDNVLKRNQPNEYLFPSDRVNGPFVGLPKVLKRICADAGLENVKIHTLRHTFASTAAELGLSELTIAGLIGHRMAGVTARYAHVPDSALVSAADKVSQHIDALLNGQSGSIISFERSVRA